MKHRNTLVLTALLLAAFSASPGLAATTSTNNHGNTLHPDHNCQYNPDDPPQVIGGVHAVESAYSSCDDGCPDVSQVPRDLPPTCPPKEPSKNPNSPCELPGSHAGFSLIDAPDSLITRGERLWLEAVYGAHGPLLRWGRPIGFGPLGRLNYLAKAHLTRDRRYIRVCEPVNSNIGVFERIDDSNEYAFVDGVDFGQDTRIRLLEETNGIPAILHLQNPDGSSVTMEFETDTEIVSDFDGYVYRVSERRTKHGEASTIAYYDDRVILTDASGHEYHCLVEDDRIVEINVTVDGETRRWTYAYNDTTAGGPGGRVTETNEQTGRTITTSLADRLAVTDVAVKHPDGTSQTASYAAARWTRNGNRETQSRVLESNGHVTFRNEVKGRVYDDYGLIRLEVGVGTIPDVTTYERNARGHYTRKTNPLGQTWNREYDRNHRLLRETSPDGGETRYEYDEAGDMVARRIKADAATWLEFRYRYDDAHRIVAAIDPEGGERRYVYDDRGLATHELIRVDEERWAVTAYTLDDNGQVLTVSQWYFVTDPDDPDAGRPGDRLTVEYDRWGNQIRRTDAMGRVSTYEWSPANKLVAKVDPAGNRTEYVYNGLGQLVSETDPLGNTTTWQYNAQLNVASVSGTGAAGGCGPCGGGAAGAGEEPGRRTWSTDSLLTNSRDAESRETTYGYDDRRRLVSVTRLGGSIVYQYDGADNVIAERDRNLEFTYYEYDEVNRRIAVTDPNGHTTRNQYDLAGRLIAVFGPDGSETRLEYDGNNRLVASRVRVDDAVWRETRTRYDLRGRVVETLDAFGTPEALVTRFVRDAGGNVVETVVDPDGLAIVTRTEYDTLGRTILDVDGNGDATAYEYDLAGNLATVISPEGRVTAYEYDAAGRMTMSTLDPDGINQFVATVYNAAGSPLEISDGATAVTHTYDRTNLLATTTVGGLYTTRYKYNTRRDLIEIYRVEWTNPIVTKLTYDNMSRLLTETRPDRNWTYAYDPAGRLIEATNNRNTTRFEYDPAGRLTRVVKPLGNGVRHTYNLAGELIRSEGGPEGVQLFEYDALGRITAEIDGNGRARRYRYDGAGRLVRLTNEMGQTVTYAYDRAGNRVSLMDANGNVSTFTYDRDGNLVALAYPAVDGQPANVERYTYDRAGRLMVKTTPNGVAIRYSYEPGGKIAAMYTGDPVDDPDDIPRARLLARYKYTAAGFLSSEEGEHTTVTQTYDDLGRLSSVRFTDSNKRIQHYYTGETFNRLRVFDGLTTSSAIHDFSIPRNAAGEVTRAGTSSDHYGRYGYDQNERRISLTTRNGTITTYEYDKNDRLVLQKISKNDEVLASFRYTHDGAGNRTGIEYADGSRSVYEYDDAYRLLRDLRLDKNGAVLYDETYQYDPVGNRLRKTRVGGRNPVDVTYVYNERNQLVAATGDEEATYEYDHDGNLVRTVTPHGVEERRYDVLGRLTAYDGPGGSERYTHVGATWKRHSAVYSPVDGPEKKYTFVYHNDNVLLDLVGDAMKLESTYVTPYLDENLAMIRAGDGYYFFGHDGLGSVRTLTTGNGYLRNSYDYTAYGEPDPVAPFDGPVIIHQRYGYTGRENNSVAGDMFYRYRNYSMTTGRFNRRDPASYPKNVFGNLYGYVDANPTNFTDPTGLMPRPVRTVNAAEVLPKCCDSLPCTEDIEECKKEAARVLIEYKRGISNIRQRSKVAGAGLSANAGNIFGTLFENRWSRFGCNWVSLQLFTGFSSNYKYFSYMRVGVMGVFLDHHYVIIQGPNCVYATAAWDTLKPELFDYDDYDSNHTNYYMRIYDMKPVSCN